MSPLPPLFIRSKPLSGALASLFLFGTGLGWAQGPINQGLPPGGPGAADPGAGGGAGAFQVPVSDTALIKVNFTNSPVQAIIPFYQQLTGKKMILDSSLQGESLRILGPKPMQKEEAIMFVEASLLLNGYAIIPQGNDTVKLIHHSGGKSPGAEGLPVFNSIGDLPKGEQIVHYVMPLEHISPDEAAKAFQQVIKLHSYGAIHPVNNSSAIIITENTTTIRSLFDIAQVIDVPPAEIANEMIKLERSDAESIAEIINEIYEEKEKSDSAPQAGNTPNPQAVAMNNGQPQNPNARGPAVANANGSSATADTNPTAAKVKVIPYRRTNQLLVIARPVDIAYIKGLVEKLDQQTDSVTFLKKKLKYMAVTDFLSVAYKALAKDTDIQTDDGDAPSSGGSRPRLSRSSNTASTDAGRSQQNNNSSQQNQFGNSQGGSFGGSNSFSNSNRSMLDDPDSAGTPESIIVGRTLLIADPHSNSLIVSGSPEHINMIDKLILEMDTRPQQIYISTVIGQLNLSDEYDYGFDFLQLLNDFTLRQVREVSITNDTSTSTTNDATGNTVTTDSTGTTTATATGLSGINGTTGSSSDTTGSSGLTNTATSLVGTAAGLIETPLNLKNFNWSQLNLYGQIGSLAKYVHLIEQDKNFKVLSRPSVYTRNNTKAVISSGQRIAVPTNILSNGGGGNNIASTSASIDYRDVVLKLEVIPLINSDDEVTLRIAQLNDNIVGTQTISGNTIPTIGTQELNTEVTVKSGSTVVLGGLITEREGTNAKGTIFLRRIPIIKHLFGTTQKSKNREELLIFIQPQIIKQIDPLEKPNQLEAGRSRVFEESLNFAGENRTVRRATPVR